MQARRSSNAAVASDTLRRGQKSRGTDLTNRVAAGRSPRRALRRLRPPESVPILPEITPLGHLVFGIRARYKATSTLSLPPTLPMPECSCGGRNPTCFRCNGSGSYSPKIKATKAAWSRRGAIGNIPWIASDQIRPTPKKTLLPPSAPLQNISEPSRPTNDNASQQNRRNDYAAFRAAWIAAPARNS